MKSFEVIPGMAARAESSREPDKTFIASPMLFSELKKPDFKKPKSANIS
jgi:hypothetical protein